MSRLSASLQDQFCAEIHQKYLQKRKGRPSTPLIPTTKLPPTTRLPPIDSENSIKSESEPNRPNDNSDFSILRFRFNEEVRSSYHNDHNITLPEYNPPPSFPLDSGTSFLSKRLPLIKNKKQISDRDLVKKWSESAYLHKPPLRNYGTNEILSIAIQSYGRGVKVSRTCGKNKTALGFRRRQVSAPLPPILERKEPRQSFMTEFKPIKVKDDRVLIARDRREFHSYGLYKNPTPYDHRGLDLDTIHETSMDTKLGLPVSIKKKK